MSLLRLAQIGTVKALPWLQRGAKALANPKIRGGLGFGLGATTTEGGLGSRLMGGLQGGLLGSMPIPGSNWAMAKSGGMLTKLGMTPHLAQNIAQIGVPLAGIGLFSRGGGGDPGPQAVNAAGNMAQGGFNTAAINMGQTANMPLPGNPNTTNVSGQHGQMMQMPDGSVWQQIDPRGYQQGIRYGSGLDTMQNISNQNKWFESVLPQWDEIERRKQARAIQNSQIASNIALARQLAGNRQIADLNIAQTQAGSMGNMFANTVTPSLSLG
jgi:hypothetical protein